jgi:hypothetical protein
MIILHEFLIETVLSVLLGMPCFHEKPTIITKHIRFDDQHVR